MRRIVGCLLASGVAGLVSGCSVRTSSPEGPSSSEVATSVVSGGLNNNAGSAMAWNAPAPPRGSLLRRAIDALNPIGTAWAATWTCTGGSLSPSFDGPSLDPYSYTPVSCRVTWDDDQTASSSWSGVFTLVYGPSCDSTHAFIENQSPGCEVTRTTGSGGNTRTITGPDGNSYSIDHDTNGTGTGWDPGVTPAPNDSGVQLTATSLVVGGSHLTGTVTVGGTAFKIWDHTVSTGPGGLTVTGTGTARVVDGVVTVQHNILMYTATSTFNSVAYGDSTCCFPTGGSVTTTFANGINKGRTETLVFSPACGEATLTPASGIPENLTLAHCL
jgi:hypothetical protein